MAFISNSRGLEEFVYLSFSIKASSIGALIFMTSLELSLGMVIEST